MNRLSGREIVASITHANALLARNPLRWLAIGVLFLVCVEGLMFVPYVGFILKLAVAGLVLAQILRMFAAAGPQHPPRPVDMLRAFQLPLSSQLVIVLSSLLPFAAGIVFLILCGQGDAAMAYFFGHFPAAPPIDEDLFFIFKCVMYVASVPVAFVAAAVVIGGFTGWPAVVAGIRAARINLPVLSFSLALGVAFELSMMGLARQFPPLGVILSVVLLIAFITWNFAFSFSVGVRVFDPPGRS